MLAVFRHAILRIEALARDGVEASLRVKQQNAIVAGLCPERGLEHKPLRSAGLLTVNVKLDATCIGGSGQDPRSSKGLKSSVNDRQLLG